MNMILLCIIVQALFNNFYSLQFCVFSACIVSDINREWQMCDCKRNWERRHFYQMSYYEGKGRKNNCCFRVKKKGELRIEVFKWGREEITIIWKSRGKTSLKHQNWFEVKFFFFPAVVWGQFTNRRLCYHLTWGTVAFFCSDLVFGSF